MGGVGFWTVASGGDLRLRQGKHSDFSRLGQEIFSIKLIIEHFDSDETSEHLARGTNWIKMLWEQGPGQGAVYELSRAASLSQQSVETAPDLA